MSPPSGPAAPPIGRVAVAMPTLPPRPGVPDSAPAPSGTPDIGSWMPVPTAFAPADPPNWLRKLRGTSRSIPGRSARPANRPSTPGARGAWSRSSTCSTTCTAAVRPNRASSARGSGSRFSIVPVASPSVSRPPEGFDSVTVSPPSSWASSSTGTDTVFDVWPAAKRSVPLVAV